MQNQLSIFNLIENEHAEKTGIKKELENLSLEYLIDSNFKKIAFGRTLTIHEIECSLTKFNNYKEYITKVYEILKKYYDIIDEKHTKIDSQTIGIANRENCIRIYQPSCQYSIWCISMIDSEFYKYAQV